MLVRSVEEEKGEGCQHGALRTGRERVLCGRICREALGSSSPTRCLLQASWRGCDLRTFFGFWFISRGGSLVVWRMQRWPDGLFVRLVVVVGRKEEGVD